MRIISLGEFDENSRAPAVVVNTAEVVRPFQTLPDGATFHFNSEHLSDSSDVIVVDTPEDDPEAFFLSLFPDSRRVQWWVPKNAVSPLITALISWESLNVVGLNEDSFWIKAELEPANSAVQSRSSCDLVRGLQLSNPGPRIQPPASSGDPIPSPSLRAVLITSVAPKFKPLKAFLPRSVVIGLYKILEKIR